MSVINESTAASWQKLADDLGAQRPYAGRRVRVTAGRRKGVEGVVTQHDRSRFSDAFRYGGEANLQMREMAGRAGFFCRVRTDLGETFTIAADRVEVLS